jgi:dihydropyrimidinase
MGVLIKNGTVVTALDRWIGDVYCREGRIVALGIGLQSNAGDQTIDASGQYVFPGGLDPHVHMELGFMGTVSADDFESGTAAGVAGGTTSIIDFCIPSRQQKMHDALRDWNERAKKAVCDYTYHMAITSWGDESESWMESCVRDHGITSFKVFMAYRDAIGISDTELIRALRVAARLGAVVTVHAEHGEMVAELQRQLFAEGKTEPRDHARSRPSPVEGEATARVLMLARLTGATVYIVHMTCREAVDALVEARRRGQRAYGETCPQYLLLDDSVYEKPDFEGAAYVMSPPIRPLGHQETLWAALRSGTIEVVGTDHCPFNQEGQKEMGRGDFRKIPNGAAGIENRLTLLYTYGVLEGKIDLHEFVNLTSAKAAKIFGLYPRKGAIAVGSDADLVVWDPAATGTISARTHHHRCDRSIYEGFGIKGMPSTVVVAGRVAYHRGKLSAERGAGRFLSRTAS